MSVNEIKLNEDKTLNILDTERFYFLIAVFPNYPIEIYICQYDSTYKYYGFVRVLSIKPRGVIETSAVYNFRNIYLQYSVQELLLYLYGSSYYSKSIFECNDQQEFIKYCFEQPAIKQILF